jgi:hypothetical protein
MQGGEPQEALRVAQIGIDAAEDDSTAAYFGMGSLLAVATAIRGSCRACLGIRGWREDLDEALKVARPVDPTAFAASNMFKYAFWMQNGALLPNGTAEQDTAEALEIAAQASDDFAFEAARLSHALVLIYRNGPQRALGYELLNDYRAAFSRRRPISKAVRFADTELAKEKARLGDLDGAIEMARETVDFLYDSGDMTSRGPAVTALVESLLSRGAKGDLTEAEAAVERLATVPTDPGFVLHELPLLRLRALLARAHGDEAGYAQYRDRYSAMANDLGFEGHMAIAAKM